MAKTGTLPHYLYPARIIEAAETTEENDNEKSGKFEPSSDEENDNVHSNIATSTTDIAGFDEGSLFLVGRLTRFGRSIKINSKFIT